jgi:hypothetical protein
MSDNMIYFSALLAVATLMIALYNYEKFKSKYRKAEWLKFAHKTGLIFSQKDPQILSDYQKMSVFNIGRNLIPYNCLRGFKGDTEILITDFSYVTGMGEDVSFWHQTLCVLKNKRLSIPKCHLRKEHLLYDSVSKFFVEKDINFDGDFAFSSDFVLTGTDDYSVKTYFSQRVRNCFVELNHEEVWFEAQGEDILLHFTRLVPPSEMHLMLEKSLNIMNELIESIP